MSDEGEAKTEVEEQQTQVEEQPEGEQKTEVEEQTDPEPVEAATAAVTDNVAPDEPAPAEAWASAAAAETEEDLKPAAEEDDPPADTEARERMIGVKIAKDFDDATYTGEVKSAAVSNGVVIYRVVYTDGDSEDMTLIEVEDASVKYDTLQEEMWNIMARLVGLDDAGLDKLKTEGVTDIKKLELFGGGTTQNPFLSLDLPLITTQQLHLVATFLLNDGILTPTSKLEDIARFNQAKATAVSPPPKAKKPETAARSSSPTKRARGRPKKTETAPRSTAKRGRGRPKKMETAGSPAKRGPGRPRAASTGSAAKRGLGRPRKTETASTGSPAKRGPPRARNTEASSTDASPAKRGRGRPKKTEATSTDASPAKRGRGRPKKTETSTTDASPAKRGRGRPKKSETGIKQETVNEAAVSVAAAASANPPKRGRGRPRKNEATSVEPAAKKTRVNEEDYRGPPTEPLEGVANWPGSASEGWTYASSKRPNTNAVDRTWYTPGGHCFRSKVAVRKFLKALQHCGGDESEALKIYKGFNAEA